MDRTKMIDYLVVNGWNEADDRETLEGLSDDKLRQLGSNAVVANAATTGCRVGNAAVWFDTTDGQWKSQTVNADDADEEEKVVEDEPEDTEDDDDDDDDDVGEPVAANMATNQWLAKAPPAVRSAVENAMEIEREAKAQVCKQLVANLEPAEQRIEFNDLMSKPLGELRKLLKLVGNGSRSQGQDHQQREPPTDHYALFFGRAGGTNGMTNNEQREVLDLESARQNYDPLIVNLKKAQ